MAWQDCTTKKFLAWYNSKMKDKTFKDKKHYIPPYCTICNKEDILQYIQTKLFAGKKWLCKQCIADANRFKNYGIMPEEYRTRLLSQEYQCAICKRQEKDCRLPGPGKYYGLVVDHSHISNNIRGLICHSCNTLLGAAKNNPEILDLAAKYLRHCFQSDSKKQNMGEIVP